MLALTSFVDGGYSEGINEFGVSIGNEMFPSHHLPTDQGSKPQTGANFRLPAMAFASRVMRSHAYI
eukprot:SAG31_NODE_642_length_13301_cov_14.143084_21_plen_66_part_00